MSRSRREPTRGVRGLESPSTDTPPSPVPSNTTTLQRLHHDDGVFLAVLVRDALEVVGILHPDAVEDVAVLVLAGRHFDHLAPHAVLAALERDAFVRPAGKGTGDAHVDRLRRVDAEADAAGDR